MAEGTARDVYDVAHPTPWGWRVSSYLWTKSISAGAFGVAAMLALTGGLAEPFGLVAAIIACVFALATVVLLVVDLKRPERFWFILLKPNFSSWLVWGAYILIAFSGVAFLWGAAALLGIDIALAPLGIVGIALAAGAAGYSGFLFGQAEGRDFWQSPMLPLHLVVQAVVAGAAVLGVASLAVGNAGALPSLLTLLVIGLVAHALIVAAEVATPHANNDVRLAAEAMVRGRDARLFWVGAVAIGVVVPLAFLAASAAALIPVAIASTVAALAALAGLLAYEDSWIRAGQAVPLS
jgi:formate-dependent nitrite reductase membrane component NrfD